MAGERMTDPGIWDKEWFIALSCKHKCLIKYIFDKCDVAGFWTPNWKLVSALIGEEVTEKDLKFIQNQVEVLPNGKVFVTDFIRFRYKTTDLQENCKFHIPAINILKKNDMFDRVCKGYVKGINTPHISATVEDNKETKNIEFSREVELSKRELGSAKVKQAARDAWNDQIWREQTCIAGGFIEDELKLWMAQFNSSLASDWIEDFDGRKYRKLFGGWLQKQRQKGYTMPQKAEKHVNGKEFKDVIKKYN